MTKSLPGAIVGGALVFNFILCFINTNITSVSVVAVIGCEVILLLMALGIGLRKMPLDLAVAGCLLVAYMLVLFTFGQKINPKVVRDLAIPFCFYALGHATSPEFPLRKFILLVVGGMLLVGLFEYFFTDTYLQYFDIRGYYASKGLVAQGADPADNALSLNALRVEGRELLPFIGEIRISSFFIEPVSMGNFAALVCLCGLAYMRRYLTTGVVLFIAGLILIVLADARLGLALVLVFVTASIFPVLRDTRLMFFLPLVMVTGLVCFALFTTYLPAENSTTWRLKISGGLLSRYGLGEWFGFVDTSKFTGDSGYAYIIPKIGFPGVMALWVILLLNRPRTWEAQIFKTGAAYYVLLSLAISESMFTIKTGAFVWFVLGAFNRELLQPSFVDTEHASGRRDLQPRSEDWAEPVQDAGMARRQPVAGPHAPRQR